MTTYQQPTLFDEIERITAQLDTLEQELAQETPLLVLHKEYLALSIESIALDRRVLANMRLLSGIAVSPLATPDVETLTPHKEDVTDGAVRDVLRQSRVQGNTVHLPVTQLERALYERVNDILERLGGKWNKRQQAHVFPVSPQEALQLVIDTGYVPPRNPTAYYPTPRPLIDALLRDTKIFAFPENVRYILEPSAGMGNIANAVRDYCSEQGITAKIHCCEIVETLVAHLLQQGFDVVGSDFLEYIPLDELRYDLILSNPPFALEDDALAYITHVQRMWQLLAPRGVLMVIVPHGFVFRGDKRVVALREQVARYGAWHTIEDKAFHESGTDVKTCVVVMRKP